MRGCCEDTRPLIRQTETGKESTYTQENKTRKIVIVLKRSGNNNDNGLTQHPNYRSSWDIKKSYSLSLSIYLSSFFYFLLFIFFSFFFIYLRFLSISQCCTRYSSSHFTPGLPSSILYRALISLTSSTNTTIDIRGMFPKKKRE